MSTTGKTILWIIVAVIVIGGIWWLVSAKNQNAGTTAANTPAGSAADTASAQNLPQGNSDQAINQEMTSINAQMNGFDSDNASITQSMNDQPVQQAE